MSTKLKLGGLSLVAALAVSAVAVLNASATAGGHFVTSGAASGTISGHVAKTGEHRLHLLNHGLEGEIGCDTQTYTAETKTETTESITVTPTYGTDCYTTDASPNPGEVHVRTNGCTFTFTVAKNTVDTTEQTVHVLCPETKKIEIEHTGVCLVKVGPQTINGGLTYTKKVNATTGKHEITMDVNVQFNTTRHNNLCIFLPTNGTGTLKGSVTVTARNHAGAQINATAT